MNLVALQQTPAQHIATERSTLSTSCAAHAVNKKSCGIDCDELGHF